MSQDVFDRVLLMVIVMLLIVIGVFALIGCAGPDKITPAEATYRQETLRDGRVVGRLEVKSTGAGVVGGRVSDYSDGRVSAGPEGGSTGAVGFKMFKELESLAPLYVAGAVAVLGGVALGYYVSWTFGLMLSGAGLTLIAAARMMETYPWVLLAPALALVAALGYSLYRMVAANKATEALDKAKLALGKVVTAVEESSPQVQTAIKAKVKKLAGKDEAAVKAEVEAVK